MKMLKSYKRLSRLTLGMRPTMVLKDKTKYSRKLKHKKPL